MGPSVRRAQLAVEGEEALHRGAPRVALDRELACGSTQPVGEVAIVEEPSRTFRGVLMAVGVEAAVVLVLVLLWASLR